MQIFIPSKGRATAICTHRILEAGSVPYTIVVDNDQEYQEYNSVPGRRMQYGTIAVSHGASLVNTRQWCLDHAQPGEWIMMMDDDVQCLYALEDPWYDEPRLLFDKTKLEMKWRLRFRYIMTMWEFLLHVREDIELAESMGANLIGYDQTENYLFRPKKYRTVEYVSFDTFLVRRTELDFDPALKSIDDFAFTAAHLQRDGKVLVNHWIRPHASHYRQGGLGPKGMERSIKRLADCEHIMYQYPGLFRLKPLRKSEPVPNPDLALRLHTEEAIQQWRQSLPVALGASHVLRTTDS